MGLTGRKPFKKSVASVVKTECSSLAASPKSIANFVQAQCLGRCGLNLQSCATI